MLIGTSTKFKAMLCVLLAIFVHFMICCLIYILNSKLKQTDNLSEMLNCIELSKCIDWNRIDSKKGLDKAIAKCRLSHERRIEFTESEQTNADMIWEMTVNSGVKNLVIVAEGLLDFVGKLKALIDSENKDIEVKVVNSLIYEINGAKSLSEADGAVILAKTMQSSVKDLMAEGQALRNRDIKLLGAVMYV